MRKDVVLRFAVLGMLVSIMLAAIPAQAAATIKVVAENLNNPRGLALGPDGAVYVAEAGRGGDGACVELPEGPSCYGATGAVFWFDPATGRQERVVRKLPSLANPETGGFAIGPHDVAVGSQGRLFVTVGLGADPDLRQELGPVGAGFAALYQGQFKRAPRHIIADLGAFEKANNPTGDEIDTNPFGLLRDGDRWIVADAGANALLEVHPNGHVKTLAIFPNRMVEAPPFLGLPPGTKIPMDEVPTSVVKGPDGAYYVGQLTGFPFPVDGARVYRITPGADPATAAEVYAEGFTNIIDIAFGPNGRLYVLEIFKNGLLSGDLTGALIRVNADGSQTLITDQLTAPGGLAITRNGTFYVSNKTIFAGKGELLQIKP